MSTSQSGNSAHDSAVDAAESTRQAVVMSAGNQATASAADIAFYRACLASAKANKIGTEVFTAALKSLGVYS